MLVILISVTGYTVDEYRFALYSGIDLSND